MKTKIAKMLYLSTEMVGFSLKDEMEGYFWKYPMKVNNVEESLPRG